MSENVNTGKKSRRPHVSHWLAELVLVFLGAYAAFWLTNYQEHRQEIQRHDQLLAALENEVTHEIKDAEIGAAKQKETVAKFRHALEAGEMPPLRPFSFRSDYSATDFATLLQSGGFQLLDVKTVIALREVESILRRGLSDISHYQKLSDELIVPNLDQDISFFYDPATKQLRKRFAAYPEALENVADFFGDYTKAQSNLLKQIQAERQRR